MPQPNNPQGDGRKKAQEAQKRRVWFCAFCASLRPTCLGEILADCAARHVQIAAFPECAVSSYFPGEILKLSTDRLVAAEQEIAQATAETALKSLDGPLAAWWRDGLRCVQIIK